MRSVAGLISLLLLSFSISLSASGDAAVEASPKREAKADAARTPVTRLVVLGSGGPPPEPGRSGSAVAVVSRGRAYLVDFGPGVVRRAVEALRMGWRALDPRRLSIAFVTHLQSDHTAGYADLILTPPSVGRVAPLDIYGPPGIAQMTEHTLAAFELDLAERKKGLTAKQLKGYEVRAHEVEPGLIYEDEKVSVRAFAVSHGRWEHALGYRFDAPDRSIVISGDTRPGDAVVEACSGCDVLVHEVYCEADLERAPAQGKSYFKTYHTSTRELAGLAKRAKPKLVVLYHLLLANCSEDDLVSEMKQYGYAGRVVVGADLSVH